MNRLLQDVAKASALREGAEGVAHILRAIHSAEVLRLKDLSVKTRVPLPVLAAVRRELERREILERRGAGLALTGKGLDFVQRSLGVESKHNALCPECQGRRIVIDDGLRPTLEKLEHYFHLRPAIDTSLDQAPCLPETSLRRALYMYESGALEGKSLIILGDDDSVSLAVGLLGKWLRGGEFCKRITVLEADTRILEHLQTASAAERFTIECLRCDLRDPLPRALCGQFDTFETDSPYTVDGATLFVSRGATALKSGSGRHGLLSFGSKPPAETLELHRRIQVLQLAVDDIIPSFNKYAGASIIGSSSQLIHVLSTPSTAATFADEPFLRKIYTGEVTPTVRLYGCLRCRKNVAVGQGEPFATIELLKAAGCPTCGNKGFRYVRRMREHT